MAGMLANPSFWTSMGGISLSTAGYMAYRNLSVDRILSLTGLRQPGGIWRLLAIIFALLNLKSLPFGWHVKVFYGLLRHIFLFKRRAPLPHPPGSLFQPVITSTRCSLLEMDYNLHKSNSTYFQDLDVARMHHLACLMRLGFHRAHFKTEPIRPGHSDKGQFRVMFGGVTCSFKKEIRPYQSYEIWTRVLSWDRKWLYMVSHIVKKGAVRPKKYTLQPWKRGTEGNRKEKETETKEMNGHAANGHAINGHAANGHAMNGHANGYAATNGHAMNGYASSSTSTKTPHPAILAVSVAKYVFKRGRRTIPPEDILRAAELLPPKPESLLAPGRDSSPAPSSSGGEGSGVETPAIEEKATENIMVDAVSKIIPQKELRDRDVDPALEADLDRWSWDAVEKERAKGMEIAQHMVGLDRAMEVWSGDQTAALGQF